MKHIDFTTLRIIILIAETGSLSAAARQCCLTLAAVSKRLLEVEALLQVSLFKRVPKGMVPTDAGRMMIAHARQLLYEMARMNANLSGFRTGEAGAVHVGGNTSAMTQFLPEELSKFSQRHPGIRLDLAELTSDEIVSRLADGRLDVGLFSANAVHKGLEVRPFINNRLCIVVRAGSDLARRKSAAFSTVLDHSLVGLENDSTLMHLLQSKAQDRHLRVSVQVRSFDVVCRFVQAGVGVGVLPTGSAKLYARAMNLAIVALTDAWAEYTLLLGTRSLDTLNAPSRLLFESLSASASEQAALPPGKSSRRRLQGQAH
jgi:DNA-binding transcriptional LysR family regulator